MEMVTAQVDPPWELDAWRAAARQAWIAQVPPEALLWNGQAQATLLPGTVLATLPVRSAPPRVPAALLPLAAAALCHRDPQRHGLLYRVLWRIASGERALLERITDPDVHRAQQWAQAVRRASHKMKAFVRFRALPGSHDEFVAWFEPEQYIVDRVAPFFARRFAGMRWAILTPYRSVRWDGQALSFAAGATRADCPADDASEALWRTYYANIFNPARLNPRAMRTEMPQKYWKHLPETALLPDLLRSAGQRVQAMAERVPEPPRRRLPSAPSLPAAAVPTDALQGLRRAVRDCRACALWQPATQAVFGEGPAPAELMVIGEQPGDAEDLSGRPFVGPAGRLFERALADLGLARERLYLTNAVKHFRFEQRGKRRLHRSPDATQVQACNGWLRAELAQVQPRALLCLGATALAAVVGPGPSLLQVRGRWLQAEGAPPVLATVHPAWVLRQPAPAREAAYRGFVADLRRLVGDEAMGRTGA